MKEKTQSNPGTEPLAGFSPSRRSVLQGGVAAAVLVPMARSNQSVAGLKGYRKELYLMDRITFGVDATMHTEYVARGWTGFLNWQLDHEMIDPAHEANLQASLSAPASNGGIEFEKPVWAVGHPAYANYNPFAMQYVKNASPWDVYTVFPSATYGFDCARLGITDLVYQSSKSHRQTHNKLVEYFTNHFNIYSQQKSLWIAWLDMIDNAIRPNALGSFEDMLFEVTTHMAMMVYLDQFSSDASNPNENFARELLELYTVGIEGNFTEDDVVAVADILTGWTVHDGKTIVDNWPGGVSYECVGDPRHPGTAQSLFPQDLGTFVYVRAKHKFGEKQVLGRTYGSNISPNPGDPAAGRSEGVQLLRDLARSPETARFLTKRIFSWLISDESPSEALLTRVMNAYLGSNTSIKELIRELFNENYLNEIFLTPHAKVRRPFDRLIWILRTMKPVILTGPTVKPEWINTLVLSGHIPSGWVTPDGHPGENEHWTAAIHPRLDMASRIAFERGTSLRISDGHWMFVFGQFAPGQWASVANAYFFLGQLSIDEVQQIQAYIVGLAATGQYTTINLMKECLSLLWSCTGAQALV